MAYNISPYKDSDLEFLSDGYKDKHSLLKYKNKKLYFKQRSPCRSLVPTTAGFFGAYLNLKIFPEINFTKYNGQVGVVMPYYHGYKPISKLSKKFLNLTVKQISGLHLVRYLSGAYDSSLDNVIYKKENFKFIDNDGRPIAMIEYGDYPYFPVSEDKYLETRVSNDIFNKLSTETVTRKNLLNEIKLKYSSEIYKKWAYEFSPKNTIYQDQFYKIKRINKNIYVQRKRIGNPPPSYIKYLSKKHIDKIFQLEERELDQFLKPIQCDQKQAYIQLVINRAKALEIKIAKDRDIYLL